MSAMTAHVFESLKHLVTPMMTMIGFVLGHWSSATDVWGRLRGQRLTVNATLTGLDSEGNTISIVNHSDRRVLIGYWSLVWVKGWPPLFPWAQSIEGEPEYDNSELTIEPRSRIKLRFADEYWFAWGAKCAPKGRLYLRIWLEGARRSRWFHLHTPGK